MWKADLEEVADELDSDAHAYAKSTGAWHGLSYDGEAVGRLIYANYGRKRDYDQLVQKGQLLFLTMAIPPRADAHSRRRLHWCNCDCPIWWCFSWSEGKQA